jgi:hypothetical protein
MTKQFEEKAANFMVAISSMYMDERDEICKLPKLDLEKDMTEDFTAMIFALFNLYKNMTDDIDMDFVGYTHLCNRLAIRHILDAKSRKDD